MPNISVSSNYPQGFANGVSIRGIPLLQSNPGQVFFVGNGQQLLPQQKAGSDNNRGTFLDPFATLNNAISVARQVRGDIIFVMPNHAETISNNTAMNFSTAGVSIIGLGSGNSRPTFTFNTATTATINVSASNMSIQNCLFIGNYLSIASTFTALTASGTCSIAIDTSTTSPSSGLSMGIMTVTGTPTGTILPGMSVLGTGITTNTIIVSQLSGVTGAAGIYRVNIGQTFASGSFTTGAQDFAIDNCEFRDLSGSLGFLTYMTDNGATNGISGFQFTRNSIQSQSTVSPTVAIVLTASHDRVLVNDNYGTSLITTTTQGPMLIAAGANSVTNFVCARNKMTRPNTSSSIPCAIATSGTAWSGFCYDNYFGAKPSGTGIWINTGTTLQFVNNYSQITGAVDKSALINPSAV